MHRKRQVVIKKQGIGTGRCGVFFLPSANPSENQQREVQTRSKPNQQNNQSHQLLIQIPPATPDPPVLLTYQPRHELPISSNPSATARKSVLSAPQKRTSVMACSILTTPSSLPLSRTESFLRDGPNFKAYPKVNYALSPTIKALACRLFVHISRTHLLCARLRAVVFVSFPSFYFFVANPHRFLVVNLLCILAFFITILVCLNLVLPRLSYIRLLLARSLPPKFKPARLPTKAPKPVVWSIGSKLQTEKKLHSGLCVQVYSNNDVYEGEFHKGKCSGSGVYHYYKSGRYEGDWIDGKYDGYGVETRARGSRYRGQYKQGLKHGIGICRFYTGDVYAGEWYNGHCHGCGIHTCEDGSKYVGEFKWGVKHGLGHYRFRNGDTYAGEYFSDKMHGFGVYLFGNGHRYEGAWHEGRRQGFGVYTFSNGETQSGHWQNGVHSKENSSQESPFAATSHPKVVPSAETSRPVSSSATIVSKVLNAAQEAQRAAGRAYNVAQIDERVNKTLVIANKAANAARVAAVKAVQKRMHDSQINDSPNSLFYV